MKSKKIENKAYLFIKEQIELNYWPNGVRLIEQDIADELQISRTPVRHAINSLINENYLMRIPNKGVIVRKEQISIETFIEQLQLLEIILSHYLFQLDQKNITFDTDRLLIHLEQYKNHPVTDDNMIHLWECFVSQMENKTVKALVMSYVNDIHVIEFETYQDGFVKKLTIKFFSQLIEELEALKYAHARKTVRVYFNNLHLELIDQQI